MAPTMLLTHSFSAYTTRTHSQHIDAHQALFGPNPHSDYVLFVRMAIAQAGMGLTTYFCVLAVPPPL